MSKNEYSETETPDVSKENFLKKLNRLKNTFYLDAHHTADRRGILILVSVSLLMVSGLWATIGGHYRQIAQDNKVTALSTDVNFSKTSVNLTLHSVLSSTDRKTVYVPFTFSNISSISTNANNYTVAVADSTGKVVKNAKGQLTIFGTTTNAVIRISSAEKFGAGPLRVIIRNDKNLNNPDDMSSDNSSTSDGVAALQKKFDIATFVINPGAEALKTSSKVSVSSSPTSMYLLLYGQSALNKNQKAIDKDDANLVTLYNRETEYRTRLTEAGFDVPTIPEFASKSYIPTSSDTTISSSGIPNDIKNKQGQTTAEYSASTSSSSDADNNGSSPADEWSSLTDTWTSILNTKIDRYVTLAGQRKVIKASISSQDSVASSAKASKFVKAH